MDVADEQRVASVLLRAQPVAQSQRRDAEDLGHLVGDDDFRHVIDSVSPIHAKRYRRAERPAIHGRSQLGDELNGAARRAMR